MNSFVTAAFLLRSVLDFGWEHQHEHETSDSDSVSHMSGGVCLLGFGLLMIRKIGCDFLESLDCDVTSC